MRPTNSERPARHGSRRSSPLRAALAGAVLLGLVLFGLSAAPAPAGAASPATVAGSRAPVWRLGAGKVLHSGASLVSLNKQSRLVMQGDGNLVLYWLGHALWATNTRHHPGVYAVMQGDGNFVVYDGHHPLWASHTGFGDSSGYYLAVQSDGNVVAYAPDHKPMWSTNSIVDVGLGYGSTGTSVLTLQWRLTVLGYWNGTPDRYFGDATQQAVWALQKAAGLNRSGVVDGLTAAALARHVVPTPRGASGNLVEVDLSRDLLMVIENGHLAYTLNTSTGGGYTYTSQGVTSVAITPTGVYNIYSEIDGPDNAPLGQLWRPKFFTGGYAIHGDSEVPPYPVSHGCVRVSDEAMNWIWATNLIPMGMKVWVF